jgi:PAS domain S-box-containing protein
MTLSYQYTPYVWPMLTGMGLSAAVGIYSWRHRHVPGAIGLAFIMLFSAIMMLAGALELTAADFHVKVFWFQVGDWCLFPITIAGLAFALGYAGLDGWLNRRTLTLIAIPFLLYIPLSFTNDLHHLVWAHLRVDERIRYTSGALTYALPAYGLLISAVTVSIFIGLFIRSPLHRRPIGLILFTMVTSRSMYVLSAAGVYADRAFDPLDAALGAAPLIYFVALFQFRLFDVVPVARNRAVEQMRDGMLVLDTQNRVADLNRAAQALLGLARSEIIGAKTAQCLSGPLDSLGRAVHRDPIQEEIWLSDACCYQVHMTPLLGRRGFPLGKLLLFSDISGRKKAQKQLQDHVLKLASLQEREWLARELHDGVGQTLAAADLHVRVTRELLARDQVDGARDSLDRLAEVIREGKSHVGDYLLGVKAWSSSEDFFSGLRRYVANYSQNTGIRTELVIPPEVEKGPLGQTVESQLQRIIQEALINIKKHAGAHSVRVVFAADKAGVAVTIHDDGCGIDPAGLSGDKGFGLRAMRGRAEALGGRFELDSTPGKGTRLTFRVPWNGEET